MNEIHPNDNELVMLDLAYTRFFEIYDEFILKDFWELSAEIRLFKFKNCFEIYSELLKYEPIKWYINYLRKHRPLQEGFFAEEYFLFIRNILNHFPYFRCWDDIFINENMAIWNSPNNSSIAKFLKKYSDSDTVKYRVWDNKEKKDTYMDINFPSSNEKKIFIKDLISEKEGMFFCMVLMRQVLESQIAK